MIEGLGEDVFRGLISFFHDHSGAPVPERFADEHGARGLVGHDADHTETITVTNPDGTTTKTTTITHPDGTIEKKVQVCHTARIPQVRGRGVEWVSRTVCKDVPTH